VIPNFFTTGGTPVPTPTANPTATPVNTPTAIPTATPTATTTSVPTSTPTSTPTSPPQGSGLIQNGGFESSSSSWVYGGVYHPRRSQSAVHSGRYSLKLGNSSGGQQGDAIAYQMVTIPSSAKQASLSFYYWPASNDSSTYGWQEADVIDSNGNVLEQLFLNTTNDRVWVQMTFDLSLYTGQTIGIQFLDHEDSGGGSYYTYMYVDDVSLNVS
jgi:hypothetical protein